MIISLLHPDLHLSFPPGILGRLLQRLGLQLAILQKFVIRADIR
jgi:hypothetical protein